MADENSVKLGGHDPSGNVIHLAQPSLVDVPQISLILIWNRGFSGVVKARRHH